ncbi:MAG: outer membrane protein transport protein [Rhodospirillales bacterium]|nr:outer membrane protein transport protein [Rhodospirillales bacterium]
MFSTKIKFSIMTAAVVAVFAPINAAKATNGMMMTCVGTYKCGMGGAGLAIASDPTAATINPALSARMGNSAIINAGWFHATVKRNITGNGTFANTANGEQTSDASDFMNASAGVNYRVDDNLGISVNVYPGGGGATDWNDSRTTVGGSNSLSDDRDMRWRLFNLQLAAAWAPNDTSAYGLGLVLARGDMKTSSIYGGVGGALTPAVNSGVVDVAYGAGFQVGGVWDVYPTVTLAADYHSRVYMERFHKYRNVFNSTLDRPATVSAGLDYKYSPETNIAFDVKRIIYTGVYSMSSQPGADGGFGWEDTNVVMLGAQHQLTDSLQVRAGYNYGDTPIDTEHVFANVLLPGIVEHHFTAGASYTMGNIDLGISGYVTPTAKITDSGSGDGYSKMGKGTWLSHKQYGSQVSLKYNF